MLDCLKKPQVAVKAVEPHAVPTEPILKEYSVDWARAHIKPEWATRVKRVADFIVNNKYRYEKVAKALNPSLPYYVVGLIHNMEASFNWNSVLHNGEKIIGTGKKTKLVPAGQGPFATWEEAAIDAMRGRVSRSPGWDIPNILRFLEGYNGFGYRNKRLGPVPAYDNLYSPYLWSGTTVYLGGRYVSDGVFDIKSWSQQVGCASVMKLIVP